MFMEKEAIPSAAAATPAPVSGKRISTKLSEAGAGAATAVAVKAPAKTTGAVEAQVEQNFATAGWTTWTALGIAALGTLTMGTLLPFWLVDLALQAGRMMLLLGR
jgi:NADH-quinone oxidoreductase subunit N